MGEAKTYEDECYCGHCDKYTKQTIHDSGHERDSSNDWRECHECGWRLDGYSGKWHEPYTNDESQEKENVQS